MVTSCNNDDTVVKDPQVIYYPYEGSILLKSQAEVDYFVSFNPGSVTGDVMIGGAGQESDITDISGMATLSVIHGSLIIRNNPQLTSLEGLGNLKEIRASLEIIDNPALISLEGLQGLTSTTRIKIINNASLQNIKGLRSMDGDLTQITIASNPQIEDLVGLEGIGFIELCEISNCNSLKSCLGLENCFVKELGLLSCPQFNSFESMATVTFANVFIGGGNSSVSSLEGLKNFTEWSQLKIYDCPQLTSLQGLDGGPRNLELHNTGITSLQGLENLEIDSINLSSNSALETLQGLNTGYTALGSFKCTNNGALQSLEGLMHVSQIDELWISDNSSLVNLDGLQNLTKAIYVFITGNASLESIEQLQSLATVGRNYEFEETLPPLVLLISGNNALETLEGIGNITSLKGMVEIKDNAALKDLCAVLDITGLVFGGYNVMNNYNPATYDELINGAACSIE